MKKQKFTYRLLAIAMCICMICGMLPMAAHAEEPTTYYVSVNSANPWGELSGMGYYAPGDTVTISANPYDGYHFYTWVVAQGSITLADEDAQTTTFIMPEENVTITANLREHGFIMDRDNGDGTHSGSCLFCDVKGEPEAHTLGAYEDNGESGHYANCDKYCGYQTELEPHVYDGDADTECDVCSHIREVHIHEWSEWTFNGDGTHTRVCKTDSSHTESGSCRSFDWRYDEETHSKKWNCDVCGGGLDRESQDYPEHVYQNDSDLTCDLCGYVRTVEGKLYITGDMPDATVGEAYSASFSHTGTVSGVVFWNATGLPDGLKIDYGTGTISGTPTTAGTYEVTISMGATGGGSAAKDFTLTVNEPKHNHSYTSVVTAPTCDEQGYTTYTCECGDSYVDNYVKALGHDWGIRQRNETYHEEYCSECGETGMQGMHTYGDDGICTACGHAEHNHTWEYRIVNESRHEPYCPGCGETGMQGMHTYGDDGICTACGHTEHNHTWEYRIVNESRHEPYCPGCGETGLQGMHTWKYVRYGASTHQEVCTVCEYKGAKLLHENHNPDEDCTCDVCGGEILDDHDYLPANCVSGEICKKCGDENGIPPRSANHVGYTCDAPDLCACGADVGNRADPYHTGGTEVRNAVEATRTEKGYTGDTYCKGCGEKLESGEEIPATGFVAVKIADDADVLEVTFTTVEGVTLPDDAELVVEQHTPSADDLDFVLGIDADTEYLDADDVKIQIVGDGVYTAPDGTEYSMYEIIQINGEKYLITNYMGTGDVLGLMRLSDGATCSYMAAVNVLDFTGSMNGTVQDYAYDKVNIGGVTYDVQLSYADAQGTIEVILYYNGSPAAKLRNYEDCYFLEGFDPETLKAQKNASNLGTVTLGESPVDGLVSGKTYNAYVVGANDISVPGYDDALLDSIKIETEAKKAAKAEVERLKADMEAKKAALDQLDTTDPDHMFAWAAWHEAETAYKMALLALTDNKKATVTQTFEIPAEFVGNMHVKYVAYHGLVEGYELGKTILSEDGKTLIATYEVDSFSPFIVYAFVEADEPEIKTLSATVVDGSDDVTETPDTSEPVESPQTSDSWIWYVLVAIAAGAIAVTSVVYGKRRKSKAN